MHKFALLLVIAIVGLFALSAQAHNDEQINNIHAHDLRTRPGQCVPTEGQIHTYVHNNPPHGVNLGIIGNVVDVLHGVVQAGVATNSYDAKVFKAALGAATPRSQLNSEGESLMVNGYDYSLSTDVNDNYYKPINGRYFKTQFSVGIQAGDDADLSLSYTRSADGAEGDVTINSIYTAAYKAIGGRAFCYAGIVHYKTFNAIGVSTAPINNECLTCNPAKYYSQPATSYTNVNSFSIGCAANYSSIPEALGTQLRRVLYTNPLDPVANAALQVHSHAVVIEEGINSIKKIKPQNVKDVKHMVSTSVIDHFNVQVYAINGLEDLEPIRRH